MVGRPRKTKETKALQGTLRPCREVANSMQPETLEGVPVPPDGLDEVGKNTWLVTATQLHKLGILTGLDLAMLKEYCYQISMMEKAKDKLDTEGLTSTIENKGGGKYSVKSPYISIYNEAFSNANRLAQQFGLSPVSRQKITVTPPKAADPLDEYMNGWNNV